MATDDSPPGSRRWAGLAAIVGVGILVVALVGLVDRITSSWGEVEGALGAAPLGWLLAGAALMAMGVAAVAVPWGLALRLAGGDVPLGQVVARFFVGELGKYVPGGVWPVVGRGELAVRAGVARASAYASVGLSLAGVYTCNAAVTVVLLTGRAGSRGTALVAPSVLVLGLGLLHPAVLRWGLGAAERVVRRPLDVPVPTWGSSVRLVGAYLPAWLLVGTATWAIARALAPGTSWIDVAGAATLSWLVGFVLVPVPGGVGVREATFVLAAGSLDPAIAAVVALLARLLCIVVDVVGAAIGGVVVARTSGRRSEPIAPRERQPLR